MPEIPVVISVGQYTNHPKSEESLVNPYDLAATVVKQCLETTGNPDAHAAIDTILSCRLFFDSQINVKPPFGRSSNAPRSIATRAGIEPRDAIYAESGGNSPQQLVAEQCERIFNGESRAGIVVGMEANRSSKLAQRQGIAMDWREEVEGSVEDRGLGDVGVQAYELAHGVGIPVHTYPLFEHALRIADKRSPAEHRQLMANLFAPFSKVAASNRFSQFPVERSIEELATDSEKNYPLNDVYPKYLVAQDAVDQAGAVLIVAESLADEWRIPHQDRVYLHGYSALKDTRIHERPDLGQSRPMQLAAERALSASGLNIHDIKFFDIYSCFPSAVLCAQKALGIGDIELDRLTLTGGLPFFGGAGNSYSIHAIIEMVKTLRENPSSFGLVLANGGYLSKQAIGIYSTNRPKAWQPVNSIDLQEKIDHAEKPGVVKAMNGDGKVINYTVVYGKGQPKFGRILGETAKGERFWAMTERGDKSTLSAMLEQEPIGRAVSVQNNSETRQNFFQFC